MSCMSMGVAGVVMPGGLFATTLVRPPSGGQPVIQVASWLQVYLAPAAEELSLSSLRAQELEMLH